MADYILSENRQIVHLHTSWKQRYIQSELDDLEVSYQVPPVEQGYINLGNGFELIPISADDKPPFDPHFQELSGPFYTYSDTSVALSYTVQYRNLDAIKQSLKEQVAVIRYAKENAGVTGNIQNTMVTIDTSRDTRLVFVQKFILMNDTDIVTWKFPECWLNLSKSDLTSVVQQSATYVQQQFNWEWNIVSKIDAATDVSTLQTLATQWAPQPVNRTV